MTKKTKKSRGPKKAWFAVKSLFRSEIEGEPRVVDADYDPDGALVEERVLLVRAGSHRQALRKAETEADKYCLPLEHITPYGQRVSWRRLGVLNSFKLFDKPGDGREAWSLTTVVPAALTDQELELQRFGPKESKATLRRRMKYLDHEFIGEVGLE